MLRASSKVLNLCMIAVAIGLSGGNLSLAQSSATVPAPGPNASSRSAEDEKVLYAFGASLANGLRDFVLSPEERKLVQAAFAEIVNGGKPRVDVAEYMPKVRELYAERQKKVAEGEKTAGAAYAAKALKEPNTEKRESGLVIRTVQAGKGKKPTQNDTVKVNYTAMLVDGTVFASSEKDRKPVELPITTLLPCWNEALSRMQVGGKSRAICPSDLAYGDSGAPPAVKPGATLIYDLELLDVISPPPEPKPEPSK